MKTEEHGGRIREETEEKQQGLPLWKESGTCQTWGGSQSGQMRPNLHFMAQMRSAACGGNLKTQYITPNTA